MGIITVVNGIAKRLRKNEVIEIFEVEIDGQRYEIPKEVHDLIANEIYKDKKTEKEYRTILRALNLKHCELVSKRDGLPLEVYKTSVKICNNISDCIPEVYLPVFVEQLKEGIKELKK